MHANFKSLKARSMGNFGEVFDLVNSVQIAKLNTCQLNLMHYYVPMAVRLQIAKFNAHQSYPLYSIGTVQGNPNRRGEGGKNTPWSSEYAHTMYSVCVLLATYK